MNKQPYTYAGTALNDGTNFESWIPEGQTILSSASPNWTSQLNTYPYLSGTSLSGGTLTIMVACKGTLQSQQETLKALFDVDSASVSKLIIKDIADSDRQWYTYCRPLIIARIGASATFQVDLAVTSPVWLTETQEAETTWNVTASGQTNNYTIDIGNLSAYPIFEFTPQTSRNAGWRHRYYIQTYNYTLSSAADYLIDVTNGGLNTTGLVNDTSVSNQINVGGGIDAVVTTIPIDTAVGGGLPTAGMGYCGTEQISWTGKTATDLTGVTRGLAGTTAAAHADNAVIALSRIKADGSDIRVRAGTTEGNAVDRPYYLSTTALAAATALKVWTPLSYARKSIGILSGNITDAQTSITLASTGLVGDTPPATGGTMLIESERITYTSYNSTTRVFSGCTRGALNTSAAAHAVSTTVRIIPVVYLYHSNPEATAPTEILLYKPVFNLSTSTNTSRVYEEFIASGQAREGWKPGVTGKAATTRTYTTDRDYLTPSDPAVEMGVIVQRSKHAARWTNVFPFGFTSAVFTDIDRQYIPANYATITSYLQAGSLKKITAITANMSATWSTENKTHTPATPHKFLEFQVSNLGTVNLGNPALMNVATVTVTLSNATTSNTWGVPSVTMGAREDLDYDMDATFTNVTTGQTFRINTEIPFGSTLRVDTLNKTVTALWNNLNRYADFQTGTTRDEWLPLSPGVNNLKYEESGVTDIDIVVKWRGRNN